jgi:hypothetical protein
MFFFATTYFVRALQRCIMPGLITKACWNKCQVSDRLLEPLGPRILRVFPLAVFMFPDPLLAE